MVISRRTMLAAAPLGLLARKRKRRQPVGWRIVDVIAPLVIIQSGQPNTGLFIYNGKPGSGNPPVAYSTAPGITKDPFGNTLPATSGGFVSVSSTNFAELVAAGLQFHNAGNTIDQIINAVSGQLILNSGAVPGSAVQSVVTLFPGSSVATVQVQGDLDLSVIGTGLRVAEGANARQGLATLVAGTVTIPNTTITANTRIFLAVQTAGGTQGFLRTTRVAGTSFTIASTSATETSTVAWLLTEPG